MASSCTKLCLRCTNLLPSKTAARTWQHITPVRHCITTTRVTPKLLNGSSLIFRRQTETLARQMWRQQMFSYSNQTAKHLEAKANKDEDVGELTGADVVPHKSPLLPASDAVLGTEEKTFIDLDDAPEFSPLEKISDVEAVSISIPPAMPPASTSLRAYVDQSETLSKLVQLGVDLWKVEKRPNAGTMLLKLDFFKDVTPRLVFLKEIGVDDSHFGYLISHNPFFLTENVDNLWARVNYLKSKHFKAEQVASMVARAPYLLNFSVKRLDNRLGFYHRTLKLSDSNTRNLICRLPNLLCRSLEPVKENLKVCEIELGLKENEIQQVIIAVPKVLLANKRKLTQIFDFIHNTMKVPHHLIVHFPQVLNAKYLRIKERHLFLVYLGKAQYDPNLPNYVSLSQLVILPDETFCSEVASATQEDFLLFLKTI